MLSQEVYRILLQRLMNGSLAPGEILNRRDLAEELGISTAPVLEALKQLEFDGYIETVPRKYTRVKLISEDDVIGNYLMRTAIESMAVRLFVNRERSAERYAVLHAAAEKLETLFNAEGSESPERWHAERTFHSLLVESGGNEKLTAEFRRVALPNFFFRTNYVLKSDGQPHNDHLQLLDALYAAPNADVAEQLIRTHIVNGRSKINALLK